MTFHPYHEEIETEYKLVESKRAIQPCYDCDRCETRISSAEYKMDASWLAIWSAEVSREAKYHLCGPCAQALPALLQQHKHAHDIAAMSVTDMPTNGDSLPNFRATVEDDSLEECTCCPCCDCGCDKS